MTERIPKSQLDQMLEEVSGYLVELETDPTLPHLGTKYLQSVLSKCRNYTNRVLFYLQAAMREEKEIKREIKQSELDLEFKMKEKLADDALVRAQPSIEDRRAVASSFLKAEYDALAILQVDIIDVQETVKILRMKYNDLQRTSADIKLQRTIVKDDTDTQMGGGAGYTPPQTRQDGSVQGGLVAPVRTTPIDPKDILDPTKRPADMPEPKDNQEAARIAAFLHRHPEKDQKSVASEEFGTGTHCIVCKKPQFKTPSGVTCELWHGDAPSVEDSEPKAITDQKPDFEKEVSAIDYASLLD
jgi:hypothetical protein